MLCLRMWVYMQNIMQYSILILNFVIKTREYEIDMSELIQQHHHINGKLTKISEDIVEKKTPKFK